MPIISAVGLFWYDKFEDTPDEKVVNMSKLTKPYFKYKGLLPKIVNQKINLAGGSKIALRNRSGSYVIELSHEFLKNAKSIYDIYSLFFEYVFFFSK